MGLEMEADVAGVEYLNRVNVAIYCLWPKYWMCGLTEFLYVRFLGEFTLTYVGILFFVFFSPNVQSNKSYLKNVEGEAVWVSHAGLVSTQEILEMFSDVQ